MCGIAGLWSSGASAELAELRASGLAMTASLHHRGPDAGAVWVDAEAGLVLGHRRLSILDLSPAGAQPMQSRCGRYVLVFNGEIYNFARLREELLRGGANFKGHSDTEILLEGFAAWGFEATLKRTNGMFALALWDRTERVLLLARDRLGEKPLYYGWQGGKFLFASELKAFQALDNFTPQVDRDVLALYLRHGYVPDPFCIYRGLRKLGAGQWLALSTDRRPVTRAGRLLVPAGSGRARPRGAILRGSAGGRRRLGGGPRSSDKTADGGGCAARGVSLRGHRFLDHRGPDATSEQPSCAVFQHWFYGTRV